MLVLLALLQMFCIVLVMYQMATFSKKRRLKKDLMRHVIENKEPDRELATLEKEILLPCIIEKNITYFFRHEELQNNHVYLLAGQCQEVSMTVIINQTRSDQSYYSINGIEVYFPYGLAAYLDVHNRIQVVFSNRLAYAVSVNGMSILEAEKKDVTSLMFRMQWGQESLIDNAYYQQENEMAVIGKRKATANERRYIYQSKGGLSFFMATLACVLAYCYWRHPLPEYVAYLSFLSMGLSFVFLMKFKRPEEIINQVKVPYLRIENQKLFLGKGDMKIHYPRYWSPKMRLDHSQVIEVSADKTLVKIGDLSLNDDVQKLGVLLRSRGNFILLMLNLFFLLVAIFSCYKVSQQLQNSWHYMTIQVTHSESVFLIAFVYIVMMMVLQLIILIVKESKNITIEQTFKEAYYDENSK